MTGMSMTVDMSIDNDVAVLTVDSPPVNALSAHVRDGLSAGIAAAVADPAVKAIVLICAGRTFIAGADITEFGKPPRGASLRDVQRDMENCPKPIVVAIHGTALGGGLEVALACHYRLAVPSAKLGLPEVKLGLLPGAGGTQRLPRLVGIELALEMLTGGAPVDAETAAAIGLIDEVAPENDLLNAAKAFARRPGLPLVRVRDRNDRIEAARAAAPQIIAEFRARNERRFRGFEAPQANIECIEAAVNLDFEDGLKAERALFDALMTGIQSKAQRYVFFAERQANKIEGLPADTKAAPVRSIGVIGAGTMGGGIAMSFLNAGIPVTITDQQQDALDRGVATVRKNYENSVAKGRISAEDAEKRIDLLTPSLNIDDLSAADLVIEAVFERMDIKKELFKKLDRIAKPGAILASNTSYLDIDEIAAVTTRPENVLGLHFFSPANVMRLLEVVRGAKTGPQVLATALASAKKVGKVAVVSGVCHGFIGNRMLARRQEQAMRLIVEGALPDQIDKVLYDFGFPMGPFQITDLAGLDVGWSAELSKGETIRDRLCEAGMRGQKNGKGFYVYDDRRNRTANPVAIDIILDYASEHGIERREIGDQEILERCLYPMVNEGAVILEEGIAQRASDIDTIWINGYGWPAYRGGPMFWADSIGLDKIAESLGHYNMDIAPMLARLVKSGGTFTGQF